MSEVYTVGLKGIRPLLMHRYPIEIPKDRKNEGEKDYSLEWLETCYQVDGNLVIPATNIERALVKAAVNYRIKGKRGKTYKDLFNASIFIDPDMVPFGLQVPSPDTAPELLYDPDQPVYIDMRRVRVQRAAVVRARLALHAGWELSFNMECISDQLPEEVVLKVLEYAGEAVGLCDYRPRFGRFIVTRFERQG